MDNFENNRKVSNLLEEDMSSLQSLIDKTKDTAHVLNYAEKVRASHIAFIDNDLVPALESATEDKKEKWQSELEKWQNRLSEIEKFIVKIKSYPQISKL